jgi:hypothetical protein
LLRTRIEILDKLLNTQERLSISLISNDEIKIIEALLKKECAENQRIGLQKYVFDLTNGKRIAVISDFNLLLDDRKRLGPIYLNQIKLVNFKSVSPSYLQSTRVMYYEV